jgi:putative colanic acid biosynthesis glycosyltransferase
VVRNDIVGIKRTYESLVAQTNEDFQWIVVDAISTDGTIEFVNNLDDKRVVFISEKDKGIYDGMNKGISLASGNYIFFLNAGDFLVDASCLHHIDDIISYVGYDIIYGSVIMRFLKNKYKRMPKKSPESVKHTLPGHHQGTFYKAELLKKYNYDLSYKESGDYYISAKLYSEGYRNYFFTERIISEFEVGHYSYKNIFSVWNCSNYIQKNILALKMHQRFFSALKRLISSLIVIIYFRISKII